MLGDGSSRWRDRTNIGTLNIRPRHFIESRLMNLDPPRYEPFGVWVRGPGALLGVLME